MRSRDNESRLYDKVFHHRNKRAATAENASSDISQRKLKSVIAFAQSGQNFHCPHDETLHPWISKMHPIPKTYLYNFEPLKLHFYIVKLGFTGIYIICLVSA